MLAVCLAAERVVNLECKSGQTRALRLGLDLAVKKGNSKATWMVGLKELKMVSSKEQRMVDLKAVWRVISRE